MIYKVANVYFSFFRIMFFGDNLKDKRWEGGGRVFQIGVPWGGRSFFLIFFKKSRHYVLWGKSTFFENWISNGMDDHFFLIFFKKSRHYVLWGNFTFFENWISNGVDDHFFLFFFDVKKCHHILWGKYTFWAYTRFDYLMETNIERIRDWITSRKQTFQSFKNGTH